jgi:hypothetical protein
MSLSVRNEAAFGRYPRLTLESVAELALDGR